MNLLDLYENREPHQQAIDKLEQRRIEDLEARMDDCAHRGDVEGFRKAKEERDSYYKVKEELGAGGMFSTLEGEELDEKLKGLPGKKLGSARDLGKSVKKFRAQRGLDEGEMKRAMEKDAERMSLEKFVAKYGDEEWIREFWNDINGPLDEAGIGHDIVNKSEKMARATPPSKAGAVASTVKNAAKWLAGKGGPGKEGPTYEGAEDIEDRGEYDQEGDMVKDNLHTIRREAEELERILSDNENVPEWVQDKLAQVKGMITSASEYMQTQRERDHEEATGKEGITFAEAQKKNSEAVEEDSRPRDLAAAVMLKKARAAYPIAGNDAEALALWIADKEQRDVNRLERENEQEEEMIARIADQLKKKEVDEGWSDRIVAQRTGQPRTPYSVYIKGKKWKDFENEDHAENVANKLRAKFEREGRDPSVITIAPTDYDKGMDEAANPAQQAAIAISMKKAGKKPKHVDETEDKPGLLAKAKDWLDTQQIKKYRKDRLPMPAGGRLANARAMFQKMAQDPKKVNEAGTAGLEDTIRQLMAPAYEEETGGMFSYTLEKKAPTMARLRNEYSDDLNDIFYNATPEELHQAAQELKAMYGQVEEAQGGDVNFGHTVTPGGWIVFDPETKQIKKRFKTHTAGKSYAKTHGLGFASSEYYFDNVKPAVTAEGITDYQKRRQRERDIDAGRPVTKQRTNKQTDYQKRRAQDKKDMELGEEKTRLDPKCWKGKKIGNPKTKMKGGVRVNNCVPAKSVEEETKKGLYYYVNKRKKAGTSRDKDDPRAPSAQDWKNAAKTAKKESVEEEWSKKYKDSINCSNPKGFSQKAHCAGKKKNEDIYMENNEARDAVESAIIRRILVAHKDLLQKFGPQKVMDAAAAIADDHADVEEIGTSDVSAYVHEVERYLAMNH